MKRSKKWIMNYLKWLMFLRKIPKANSFPGIAVKVKGEVQGNNFVSLQTRMKSGVMQCVLKVKVDKKAHFYFSICGYVTVLLIFKTLFNEFVVFYPLFFP